MTTLNTLKLNALTAIYNAAVLDYNPEGFGEVDKFKSKAHAVERINDMCKASGLAVNFEGETATIVDAMDNAFNGLLSDMRDKGEPSEGEGEGEGEGDDVPEHGDGKGEIARSGFHYGSAAWLAANPRGTEAREAYRSARKKAARMARKAERAAKVAAQEAANA